MPCKMTKKLMDQLSLDYTEIDLDSDPNLRPKFRDMGMTSAPIVDVGTDIWAGYRPDRIKQLTNG